MFTNWRKSSKSLHNPEQCVEVATAPGRHGVRDSKNPESGTLTLSCRQWADFLNATKHGRYDS